MNGNVGDGVVVLESGVSGVHGFKDSQFYLSKLNIKYQ